jgi:two-component system response regulator FlrC
MQTLTVSPLLDAADPALVPALRATGLVVAVAAAGPKDGRRVLLAGEGAQATCRDVLVERGEGAPRFTPAAGGRPTALRFGTADRGFGHALVAELLRADRRPAAADAESARLLSLAARVAGSDATALILGETGTGKEGMARFMHAASARAGRDFIAVNCAALPETMLEAMFFGHQKGSFTGAAAASEGLFRAAHGGTLFLDESAELPLPLQAKLLRAIQEREVLPVGATRAVPVDVRLIAAANRDLAAEVEAGRFRADLFWRLNVLPITLRPLAARPADVPAILAALLLRHAPASEPLPWPTADAVAALQAHRWPGNVRELENLLQRALLLRSGERLEAADFGIEPVARPAATIRLAEVSRSSETQAIADALAATGGNRVRAAGLLGISERTLRYRLAGLRAADQLAAA